MDNVNNVKAIIAAAGAWLSVKLGILWPILLMLTAVMVVDYCTGLLAAKKENKIQSKVGMWGIVKKLLYGIAVAVGMIVDWTILTVANTMHLSLPISTFFGLLVSIWLIINELISILENLTRMEVPLPGFLLKVISNFKIAIENQGNELVNKLDSNMPDKEAQ